MTSVVLALAMTLCWALPVAAQAPAPSLRGKVTAAAGEPIAEARVMVVELSRSAQTGPSGQYAFPRLPAGTYSVSFSSIGYQPEIRRITISSGTGLTLDIALRRSFVELAPLQVTSSARATDPLTSPQPVSVLSGRELRTAQSASVGETLEGLAGVRSWSTGPGIGKPVIRGLTSNRVLVVADGQRMEYQQWGDEHSPNVETANAASVEVVRGPASVLYGSDALGGVVNIVSRPLPDAIGARRFVQGRLNAAYATNNRNPDGTLMLEGAQGGFGWRGSLTGRTSADVRTPDAIQLNTGNRAISGDLKVGQRAGWGEVSLGVTRRDERVEIHEDPAVNPLGSSYQRLRDDRARLDVMVPVGASRLETAIAVERNRRSEFARVSDPEVTTGLLSRAITGDVRFRHAPIGPAVGTLGLSALNVSFDGFGTSALVPDNVWRSFGAYLFEQASIGTWDLSLGARADYRSLDAEADAALGNAASTRSWSAVTGNLGVLYRPAEWIALVFNAGRGFRTPSGPELFANGVHQGVLAYEIGNPDLGVETSFNVDLGVRMQTERLRVEAGVFRNAIRQFIYLSPTGSRDPASNLPVYRFEQGDALLTGFEVSAEVRPWEPLRLRGTVDYVRGDNVTTSVPLPWIPPLRASWGVRLEGDVSAGVRNGYVGVYGETDARQTRLAEGDYAPRSYSLLNAEAGFAIPGANRLTVDLLLRNVLDGRFTRFMNRYKTYSLEQGRNLVVRTAVAF